MTSDRDREILAETERQLRREAPDLARRFERTKGVPRRPRGPRIAHVVTSIPVMVLLLLLLVGSMVLGLGLITLAIGALAATSICFRIRRERDG